jgi:hypothetical protein
LTGLTADDHPQYVPLSGTRGAWSFTTTEYIEWILPDGGYFYLDGTIAQFDVASGGRYDWDISGSPTLQYSSAGLDLNGADVFAVGEVFAGAFTTSGTNPAQSGLLRARNASPEIVVARNSSNDGDSVLLHNTNGVLTLGNTVEVSEFYNKLASGGYWYVQIDTSTIMVVDEAAFVVDVSSAHNFDVGGSTKFEVNTSGASLRGNHLYGRTFDARTPSALSAQANNYDPTGFGFTNLLRQDLTGSQTITGFAAPTSSDNGDFHIVNIDAGSDELTLAHESTSSTAANRILCPGGTNLVLGPGESAHLVYDETSARWRVVAVNSGSGGSFSETIISPAITASQNDWGPTDIETATIVRANPDGSGPYDITGIDVTGVTVLRKKLYNVGSSNLVLKHNSTSSTAGNRFTIPGAADLTLEPNDVVDIFLDSTSTTWRVG